MPEKFEADCKVIENAITERDLFREVLESILEITQEDHASRPYSSMLYEIRTYARNALNR